MIARLAIAAAAAALVAAPASGEPASPWTRDGSSELRLIDAGAAPDGGRLVGVAIRLDAGWKTYWRQPGDSGVPPQFDFAASTNLAGVDIAYPAPERMTDESGIANVYHGEVVLPATVRAQDPSRPVRLALVANYGVCDKVCVPVRAETALDLAPEGAYPGPAAAAVRRALAKTPKRTAFGAAAEGLSIASVSRRDGPDGKPAVEVVAAAPGPVTLFAETGEGGFVRAPEPLGGSEAGKARFRIPFDRELPASGLRLTLAAPERAIETSVPLGAILRTP
ncbi:protein-disulfide reductase DsbD domain-containing protein [Methylopila henanensis]|uniref:Protein-disulfide reductase DsbD domain-containing protein n=1 Tax=Methylopila henanensis TaxID=873516 RepID=A0ABW4KCC3_9HYPH